MYKLYIDEAAFEYLRGWAESIKRYAVDCPPVASKFQIIIPNAELGELNFYVQPKRTGYKFTLVGAGGQLCKGNAQRTPGDEHDLSLSIDISDKVPEAVHAKLLRLCQGYMTAFLHANAFLMYGNVIGEKEIVAAGRNVGADKVIVFRPFKDKLYAVPVGHHRSPEGVFEVRGHFRHYKKTGKIVWIDAYLKGKSEDEE